MELTTEINDLLLMYMNTHLLGRYQAPICTLEEVKQLQFFL